MQETTQLHAFLVSPASGFPCLLSSGQPLSLIFLLLPVYLLNDALLPVMSQDIGIPFRISVFLNCLLVSESL